MNVKAIVRIRGLVLGEDQSEINLDNLPRIAKTFDTMSHFDG